MDINTIYYFLFGFLLGFLLSCVAFYYFLLRPLSKRLIEHYEWYQKSVKNLLRNVEEFVEEIEKRRWV